MQAGPVPTTERVAKPCPPGTMHVPPLAAGCPWADWARPNAKWCEENRCALITTPANTWTNVAYLVVALVVAREATVGRGAAKVRGKPPSRAAGLAFAAALVFVGLSSFAFHASYTLVFQFGDFLGMFTFCALPTVLNLRRLGWLRRAHQVSAGLCFVAGGTLLMGVMAVYRMHYQVIVLFMIVACLALECLLYLREAREARRATVRRGDLVTALALLLVAVSCSALDMLRVWCEPASLLQGHAAWHIVSAVGLLYIYRFYAGNFHLDAASDDLPLLRVV